MKGKIFSTGEVQAIVDGRKSQFREIIKPQPIDCFPVHQSTGHECEWRNEPMKLMQGINHTTNKLTNQFYCEFCGNGHDYNGDAIFKSKYIAGDILYVKETFKKPDCACYDNCQCPPYIYKANFEDGDYPEFNPWRQSVQMKESAARIFVEITKVRVEKISDISHFDSRAEGVYPLPHRCAGYNPAIHTERESQWCPNENTGATDCHRCAIHFQWMKEYGPKYRSEAWNLWVFAYDFKIITNHE